MMDFYAHSRWMFLEMKSSTRSQNLGYHLETVMAGSRGWGPQWREHTWSMDLVTKANLVLFTFVSMIQWDRPIFVVAWSQHPNSNLDNLLHNQNVIITSSIPAFSTVNTKSIIAKLRDQTKYSLVTSSRRQHVARHGYFLCAPATRGK